MSADLPATVPIPEPRPLTGAVGDGEKDIAIPKPDLAVPKQEPEIDVYVPPPIEREDAKLLSACLAELKTLGVEYAEVPAIDDGNGCGIDHPLVVTSLGGGVRLLPEGRMRCETARQLARWTADTVTLMAKIGRPAEKLVGLDQASAYVCRKRNGARVGKISEHAHGNAVDIAGLRFESGQTFSIQPRMQDSTMDGALQRAITAAACLYFTTVLDPGSDKAHETHLHLDVLKRKGGYRYCW